MNNPEKVGTEQKVINALNLMIGAVGCATTILFTPIKTKRSIK